MFSSAQASLFWWLGIRNECLIHLDGKSMGAALAVCGYYKMTTQIYQRIGQAVVPSLSSEAISTADQMVEPED